MSVAQLVKHFVTFAKEVAHEILGLVMVVGRRRLRLRAPKSGDGLFSRVEACDGVPNGNLFAFGVADLFAIANQQTASDSDIAPTAT